MRAAIFGGTFNPVHNGHMIMARRVLRHFSLDRLFIIPCRQPPHKSPDFLAPADHRLQMIRLALPDDDRYIASDIEIRRNGPSYTIDTIDHLVSREGCGADFFLVMGLDAFLELHTWKSQHRIREAVQLVVVSRTVDDGHRADPAQYRMHDYIRTHLSADYVFDDSQTCWRPVGAGQAIHLFATDPVDVSSTQVRQCIRAGKAITGLVPPAVCTYIEKKGLYR